MPQNFPITFKEEQPQVFRGKTFQGLGIDYGLIFISSHYKMILSLDGINTETISSTSYSDYQCLFFDKEEKKLYYNKSNVLYEWPNKLIKDFNSKICGITKFKKEIIMTLYSLEKISNIEGKTLFDGLRFPYELEEFQGKLYYSSAANSGGLLETSNRQTVATTGGWTNGLDISPDGKRLYFGGQDRNLYSYDGKQVKNLCSLNTNIWSIHTVKEKNEVIYCAGGDSGIEKITLSGDKVLERETIIKSISSISSIVHAPIDFIKSLKENK
jgi:WD40 repeat protein